MKKALSIITFCLFTIAMQAQTTNEKFVKAMEKALAGMDTLKTAEQWQESANAFERIALKEPKEWLPAYYVALGHDMAFNLTQDVIKQELLAKRAEEFINAADALNPDNAEIYVLKSMVSGLFIRLNPMVNGRKYAPLASAQLEKALSLDPENPRAYMQKGLTLFFTPAQWGGDKVEGKRMFETASAKFAAFKAASSIHPVWGNRTNNMFLEMANQ
jgi:tetratricopeptide (TPR) repeat protein